MRDPGNEVGSRWFPVAMLKPIRMGFRKDSLYKWCLNLNNNSLISLASHSYEISLVLKHECEAKDVQYKASLFKFRRHLCKGFMEFPYEISLNLGITILRVFYIRKVADLKLSFSQILDLLFIERF